MARHGWDAQPGRVRMPAAGDTVNSEPFSLPRNTKALLLFIATTLAGAATLALQALEPTVDVDAGTENWRAVAVYNLSTPGTNAISLTNAQASGAISFPVTGLGGGVFRWVASADQSGAAQTFHMLFSTDV